MQGIKKLKHFKREKAKFSRNARNKKVKTF